MNLKLIYLKFGIVEKLNMKKPSFKTGFFQYPKRKDNNLIYKI